MMITQIARLINEKLANDIAPYNQYRIQDQSFKKPVLPAILAENIETKIQIDVGLSVEYLSCMNLTGGIITDVQLNVVVNSIKREIDFYNQQIEFNKKEK